MQFKPYMFSADFDQSKIVEVHVSPLAGVVETKWPYR